jgi:hypothetical protein
MQVAVEQLPEHPMQVEVEQLPEHPMQVEVEHEREVTLQRPVAHERVVTLQQVLQRELQMQMVHLRLQVQPVSRTNLKSHQLVRKKIRPITVQTERKNRLTTLKNKRAIGFRKSVDSGVLR